MITQFLDPEFIAGLESIPTKFWLMLIVFATVAFVMLVITYGQTRGGGNAH